MTSTDGRELRVNDRAPDRHMANIWSALRRRKVVQWGACLCRGLVYVAGALGFHTMLRSPPSSRSPAPLSTSNLKRERSRRCTAVASRGRTRRQRDREIHFCAQDHRDRKSTRLNSSHSQISYAVFCL